MLSVSFSRSRGALLQHQQRCLSVLNKCGGISGAITRACPSSQTNLFSSLPKFNNTFTNSSICMQRQYFSSDTLSKDEEEKEKYRVSTLSPEQKKHELRLLDDEIKRLNCIRAINTGEFYTWRGKFKGLVRDYGIGCLVWYYATWGMMFSITYLGIEYGGIDALALIEKFDFSGYDVASRISPATGSIAVALIANECLEPIRIIFVVSTVKPVVDMVTKRT